MWRQPKGKGIAKYYILMKYYEDKVQKAVLGK